MGLLYSVLEPVPLSQPQYSVLNINLSQKHSHIPIRENISFKEKLTIYCAGMDTLDSSGHADGILPGSSPPDTGPAHHMQNN